jgi:ATP-binding cassette subfamily B protein
VANPTTEELKKVQAKNSGGGHGGPGGGPPAARVVDKPKHFGRTMKKLAGYLKQYMLQIILTVIFAIASTVFAIVSPKILGNMTNQIVDDYVAIKFYDGVTAQAGQLPAGTTGAMILDKLPADKAAELSKMPENQLDKVRTLDMSVKPSMNYGALGQTALILIGLYVLSALFGYIQGWIISGVTQRLTYRFRSDLSVKINRLPLSYFDKRSYGDVLSRVTNDVDLIGQSLSQSLSQMITSVTTIIGILVMMISISLQLTGIAILVVPLSLAFIGLIVRRSQKYFKKQQDSLGALNGHIEEIYAGHNVVRAFGGEKQAMKKFDKYNRSLHDSAWRSQFLSGLMFPIMNFLSNLGYVGVAILGGYMAINGRISIGNIQAFIQYMSQFNQPIMQVANIANVVQSTAAAAERVFEFLAEPEETPDPAHPIKLARAHGNVDFDHIRFGYDPAEIVIKDFSAHIKAGQTVAIVGPTGAGKTTMVNLLMRFYDPLSGDIKIDGVNTLDMTRANVRSEFAMVLQDTWLFSGTIRENIAYGNLQADDEQIAAAARAAHVDHFIRALPQGYDTVLDEDAENISQGERQLLTIARAMLADAPMLILDEATSNVDTRTEILIQRAMGQLMRGRTSFVIAHRLSTIRDADLILVMNHGNIVEQGTHDSLLAANGFYAQIYNSQFIEV